jgi:anti-sigma factor RsiW
MPPNAACKSYIPLLSPFIDGELSTAERQNVERHLGACKDCTGRAADLRAEAGLVRVGLEMAADEVDFKDFAQKVMARVTPEKAPLLERLKLSLSEMFTYQKPVMISSFATAAVLALVAVPLLLGDRTPDGYASKTMMVEKVSTSEDAKVQPVVLQAQGGDAIIWVVDSAEPEAPKLEVVPEDEAQDEELDMAPTKTDSKTQPKGRDAEHPKGGTL